MTASGQKPSFRAQSKSATAGEAPPSRTHKTSRARHGRLKTERVIHFCGEIGAHGMEFPVPIEIFQVVIQHQIDLPAGLGNPVQAAIYAEHVRIVILLNEIYPG